MFSAASSTLQTTNVLLSYCLTLSVNLVINIRRFTQLSRMIILRRCSIYFPLNKIRIQATHALFGSWAKSLHFGFRDYCLEFLIYDEMEF